MRSRTAALAAAIALLINPLVLLAQSSQSSQSSPSMSVPRLIEISGVFRPADGGKPVGVETVTFGIYADETGGEPLWQETQSVTVHPSGNYSLLLGATAADGVPLDVFASGQARWLSMTWSRAGEVEGPRTRLTSVPYALRASDAATLGGKPASAYQLAPTAGGGRTTSTASPGVSTPQAVLPGTTNVLAKYVNGADVGDSAVYESGGFVGINTTSPLDVLHARFTNGAGNLTGIAVQNLANTATSYSGMLFYDHTGALGQFQGFNNSTKEYRINNIAAGGTINFMTGGASRLKINNNGNVGIGVTSPTSKLEVSDPTSGAIVVEATNTFSGNFDGTAILGTSVNNPGHGNGGSFSGGRTGVYATAVAGNWPFAAYGVYADVTGSAGLRFAVHAIADADAGTSSAYGIYARATGATTNWAGYFHGNVHVAGTLSKAAGAFTIDHPLDPENKYLSHSFVESPDMKNIYDGTVTTDRHGDATVTLPNWVEALNRDFRYQLTVIGQFAQAIVAHEITGNQFTIKTDKPGVKVSWQVTGIRKDRYAEENRIRIEEDKVPAERGKCLYPPLCGGVALDVGAPSSAESGGRTRGR